MPATSVDLGSTLESEKTFNFKIGMLSRRKFAKIVFLLAAFSFAYFLSFTQLVGAKPEHRPASHLENSCSGHGDFIDKKCACHIGYSGENCSSYDSVKRTNGAVRNSKTEHRLVRRQAVTNTLADLPGIGTVGVDTPIVDQVVVNEEVLPVATDLESTVASTDVSAQNPTNDGLSTTAGIDLSATGSANDQVAINPIVDLSAQTSAKDEPVITTNIDLSIKTSAIDDAALAQGIDLSAKVLAIDEAAIIPSVNLATEISAKDELTTSTNIDLSIKNPVFDDASLNQSIDLSATSSAIDEPTTNTNIDLSIKNPIIDNAILNQNVDLDQAAAIADSPIDNFTQLYSLSSSAVASDIADNTNSLTDTAALMADGFGNPISDIETTSGLSEFGNLGAAVDNEILPTEIPSSEDLLLGQTGNADVDAISENTIFDMEFDPEALIVDAFNPTNNLAVLNDLPLPTYNLGDDVLFQEASNVVDASIFTNDVWPNDFLSNDLFYEYPPADIGDWDPTEAAYLDLMPGVSFSPVRNPLYCYDFKFPLFAINYPQYSILNEPRNVTVALMPKFGVNITIFYLPLSNNAVLNSNLAAINGTLADKIMIPSEAFKENLPVSFLVAAVSNYLVSGFKYATVSVVTIQTVPKNVIMTDLELSSLEVLSGEVLVARSRLTWLNGTEEFGSFVDSPVDSATANSTTNPLTVSAVKNALAKAFNINLDTAIFETKPTGALIIMWVEANRALSVAYMAKLESGLLLPVKWTLVAYSVACPTPGICPIDTTMLSNAITVFSPMAIQINTNQLTFRMFRITFTAIFEEYPVFASSLFVVKRPEMKVSISGISSISLLRSPVVFTAIVTRTPQFDLANLVYQWFISYDNSTMVEVAPPSASNMVNYVNSTAPFVKLGVYVYHKYDPCFNGRAFLNIYYTNQSLPIIPMISSTCFNGYISSYTDLNMYVNLNSPNCDQSDLAGLSFSWSIVDTSSNVTVIERIGRYTMIQAPKLTQGKSYNITLEVMNTKSLISVYSSFMCTVTPPILGGSLKVVKEIGMSGLPPPLGAYTLMTTGWNITDPSLRFTYGFEFKDTATDEMRQVILLLMSAKEFVSKVFIPYYATSVIVYASSSQGSVGKVTIPFTGAFSDYTDAQIPIAYGNYINIAAESRLPYTATSALVALSNINLNDKILNSVQNEMMFDVIKVLEDIIDASGGDPVLLPSWIYVMQKFKRAIFTELMLKYYFSILQRIADVFVSNADYIWKSPAALSIYDSFFYLSDIMIADLTITDIVTMDAMAAVKRVLASRAKDFDGLPLPSTPYYYFGSALSALGVSTSLNSMSSNMGAIPLDNTRFWLEFNGTSPSAFNQYFFSAIALYAIPETFSSYQPETCKILRSRGGMILFPDYKKMETAVLNPQCHDNDFKKSFQIIFQKKGLDMSDSAWYSYNCAGFNGTHFSSDSCTSQIQSSSITCSCKPATAYTLMKCSHSGTGSGGSGTGGGSGGGSGTGTGEQGGSSGGTGLPIYIVPDSAPVLIVNYPSIIANCDKSKIRLDLASTTGSSVSFFFIYDGIDQAFSQYISNINGTTDYFLSLEPTFVVTNKPLEFTVIAVSNFRSSKYKYSVSKLVKISRDIGNAPNIMIQLGSAVISMADKLSAKAKIRFSSCANATVSNATVSYLWTLKSKQNNSWTAVNIDASSISDGLGKNSSDFMIKANRFSAGEYLLSVVVNYNGVEYSSEASVKIISSLISCRFSCGANTLIGIAQSWIFSATFEDPAKSASMVYNYMWQQRNGNILTNLSSTSNALTIPPNSLAAGTNGSFVFTIADAADSNRNCTAIVGYTTSEKNIPTIEFNQNPPGQIISSSRKLTILVAIKLNHKAAIASSLSCKTGGSSAVSLSLPSISPESPALELMPGMLTANSNYTISCTAVVDGTSVTGEHSFTTSRPPFGGVLSVTNDNSNAAIPNGGYAFLDSFTIMTSGWVTAQFPVKYDFGFNVTEGSKTKTVFIALNSNQAIINNYRFPANTTLVFVQVTDGYGTSTTISSEMKIAASDATIQAKIDSAKNFIKQAINLCLTQNQDEGLQLFGYASKLTNEGLAVANAPQEQKNELTNIQLTARAESSKCALSAKVLSSSNAILAMETVSERSAVAQNPSAIIDQAKTVSNLLNSVMESSSQNSIELSPRVMDTIGNFIDNIGSSLNQNTPAAASLAKGVGNLYRRQASSASTSDNLSSYDAFDDVLNSYVALLLKSSDRCFSYEAKSDLKKETFTVFINKILIDANNQNYDYNLNFTNQYLYFPQGLPSSCYDFYAYARSSSRSAHDATIPLLTTPIKCAALIGGTKTNAIASDKKISMSFNSISPMVNSSSTKKCHVYIDKKWDQDRCQTNNVNATSTSCVCDFGGEYAIMEAITQLNTTGGGTTGGDDSSSSGGVNTGAAVGGAVGAVLAVGLIGGGGYYAWKKKQSG